MFHHILTSFFWNCLKKRLFFLVSLTNWQKKTLKIIGSLLYKNWSGFDFFFQYPKYIVQKCFKNEDYDICGFSLKYFDFRKALAIHTLQIWSVALKVKNTNENPPKLYLCFYIYSSFFLHFNFRISGFLCRLKLMCFLHWKVFLKWP